MQPGTPEHAAALEALCLKLTGVTGLAAEAIERQERQIAALMGCVAAREMEERCGVDRAELARSVLATLGAELGEDPDRDFMLRSLLGQSGEPPAGTATPGLALRLILGGKV